ncbi:MAG TPA: DUF4339 domain-containing protein [Puia sp.]|nr:DUF4339 domain-containing protein [Puia sp.]
MTMYLLLRNNKQSGPYSLDELKSMGLKAYDLVWVEGRSAAWRYPCEIEELRNFAPAVEEQPFDRFFRKPGQSSVAAVGGSSGTTGVVALNGTVEATGVATFNRSGEPALGSPALNRSGDIATAAVAPAAFAAPNGNGLSIKPIAETPAAPGESPVFTGKRIIYVNLPAGRPVVTPVRETPVRETPAEKPRVAETAMSPMVPAIEDYPSLRERAGASAVEFAPRRNDRRSGKKNDRLLRIAAVGVCIVALLAAGIFIGLSLNKESLGIQHRIAGRPATIQATQAVLHSTAQTPVSTAANAAAPLSNPERSGTAPAVTTGLLPVDGPAKTSVGKPVRTRRPKEKESDRTAQLAMPPVTKDSALTVAVESREAVHRTDVQNTPPDEKQAARASIASQVSVGANGYSVGTFGGINGLQLTVSNKSTYPLDLVVVEVQYIQANKKIYKTENIYFRDIGPGAAMMQEAPKSSRGIRVQCKITSISSKELGLSYSGI